MKKAFLGATAGLTLSLAAGVAMHGCGKDAASGGTFTIKGKAKTTATASLRLERLLDRISPISQAHATGDLAGSVTAYTIKFYRFWVSQNADCTGLELVGDNGASGKDYDITTNPTLISSSPANGTYRCVAFEMDDTFTLVPDATAAASLPGLCVAGTAAQQDIYRTNSGAQPTGTDVFKDYDGNSITAHGQQDNSTNTPVADKVLILASTDVSAVTARGYSPNQTVTLVSPMVVPGQVSFVLDLYDHIEPSTNRCGMSQIPMSFE